MHFDIGIRHDDTYKEHKLYMFCFAVSGVAAYIS